MQNENQTFVDFKKRHKHFFWWIKDVSKIDEASMIEATLTYGNMEERKELMNILGKANFRANFEALMKSRRAKNLEPRTLAYWSRYLSR